MGRRLDVLLGAVAVAVLAAVLVVGVLLVYAGSPAHSHLHHVRRLATWSRYSVDGDEIRIKFEDSTCGTGGASLQELPDRVVITAYLNAPAQICVETVTGHQAEVRLQSPLGTRTVYDGACLELSGVSDDPRCVRWLQSPG